MALDEDHADDVLVVARDQHGVFTNEHPNRGLASDLAQPDGLHNDRAPAIIADPRDITCLVLSPGDIENCHNSIVSQYAFNSCRRHRFS